MFKTLYLVTSKQLKFCAFIAFTFLMSPQLSYACLCQQNGTFSEFSEFSEHNAIIRGKIKSYGSKLVNTATTFETMNVVVIETIKGDISHDEIIFVGDLGADCLLSITSSEFPLGSEFLFIVVPKAKIQGLTSCGETFLRIREGRVYGMHVKDENWTPYSHEYVDFLASLKFKE